MSKTCARTPPTQVMSEGAVGILTPHHVFLTPSGEYTADHECIQMFWSVIERFSEQERCLLLKFVTSCSRPPLLGFKELYPPFCVMSGGREQRLPSASTCMNLLKLPMFPDVETMRSKLLYAISSGAGFELS